MEELKTSGRRKIRNTREKIIEESLALTRDYSNQIINQIIEAITSEIKGIPESYIISWIEDYLIPEIKTSSSRYIEKMYSSMEEHYNEIIHNIDLYSDPVEEYNSRLKDLYSQRNFYWCEEIFYSFKKEILRKIENFYDPFYGIGTKHFQKAYEIVEENVHFVLNKLSKRFLEEYQNIIKTELRNHANKMSDVLVPIKNISTKLSPEEFKEVSTILRYNGFELFYENGQYYARSVQNNELIKFKYKKLGQVGSLESVDREGDTWGLNITFDISSKIHQIGLLDGKRFTIIAIAGDVVQVGTMDSTEKITIKETIEGYEFYSQNSKVTTKESITEILKKIEAFMPGYYKEIIASHKSSKGKNDIQQVVSTSEVESKQQHIFETDVQKALRIFDSDNQLGTQPKKSSLSETIKALRNIQGQKESEQAIRKAQLEAFELFGVSEELKKPNKGR